MQQVEAGTGLPCCPERHNLLDHSVLGQGEDVFLFATVSQEEAIFGGNPGRIVSSKRIRPLALPVLRVRCAADRPAHQRQRGVVFFKGRTLHG